MEQRLERTRADVVAQTCSLPHRRVALGQAYERAERLVFFGAWQNTILRYGRVQLCATLRVTSPTVLHAAIALR